MVRAVEAHRTCMNHIFIRSGPRCALGPYSGDFSHEDVCHVRSPRPKLRLEPDLPLKLGTWHSHDIFLKEVDTWLGSEGLFGLVLSYLSNMLMNA
jgi:hypothetical protein